MSALPLEDVATARAVELPPTPQGDHTPGRTPLALVRPAPRRRRKWPFVLMCVLVVAAVVGTVLVLNVSVSRTQYQLVSLRAEQQAVAQENGALTEEINNRRAPQNLAKQAKAESMVPGGQPGVVDLTKGKLTAQAAPAAADAKASAKEDALHVAVPLTPAERAAAVAKKQEQAKAAQAAATAEANAKASGASSAASAATADENETAGAPAGQESAAGAAQKGSGTQAKATGSGARQLNGGTIPGPSN